MANILDLVQAQVSARPRATALLYKPSGHGQYVPLCWSALWDQVREVARSLLALGIAAGDRVGVASNTRFEWVVHDLGIVAAGAVTVPIYASSVAEDCRFVAEDAGIRLVFCEDREQVAKFVSLRERLPSLLAVVQMSGEVEHGGAGWVMSSADFLALGRSIEDAALDERRAALGAESMFSIIYTSGTTGRPKGVIMTHANMLYEAKAIVELGLVEPSDTQLLFLPLAHSFARMLEVCWLATGHVLAFAESMATIKQNLAEVRPTVMAGVPRVFEKFFAAVVDKGMATPGLRGKLFARALALSAKHGEREAMRARLGPLEALEFALLRKLVLAKVGAGVRQTLGDRMRFMLTGGAPLSNQIAWFFRDVGIELLVGYGLTESASGSVLTPREANEIGTIGVPLPGTAAKLAADGEILLRGPGIMPGYWHNPAATAEVLVDGWLHTGDIGEMDGETGVLRITDRKKDLIVTAGGENIAPQKLENLVTSERLIAQCVVHGDARKFVSAVVTLDAAALREFAEQHGLTGSHAELSARPEVRAAVEAAFARVNAHLPSYETIKKFAILPTEFSIETGELTPKLSVRRKVVHGKYAALFDGFYAEAA